MRRSPRCRPPLCSPAAREAPAPILIVVGAACGLPPAAGHPAKPGIGSSDLVPPAAAPNPGLLRVGFLRFRRRIVLTHAPPSCRVGQSTQERLAPRFRSVSLPRSNAFCNRFWFCFTPCCAQHSKGAVSVPSTWRVLSACPRRARKTETRRLRPSLVVNPMGDAPSVKEA